MVIVIINQRSGRFKAFMSVLPPAITNIIFSYDYDQPTILPPTITHCTVGKRYNEPMISQLYENYCLIYINIIALVPMVSHVNKNIHNIKMKSMTLSDFVHIIDTTTDYPY